MAYESFGRRIPFAFLDNIKSRFLSSYGENAKNAMAYGMNADFSRVLQIQMVFLSFF
jgi:vesicle-associated membrane protein 7